MGQQIQWQWQFQWNASPLALAPPPPPVLAMCSTPVETLYVSAPTITGDTVIQKFPGRPVPGMPYQQWIISFAQQANRRQDQKILVYDEPLSQTEAWIAADNWLWLSPNGLVPIRTGRCQIQANNLGVPVEAVELLPVDVNTIRAERAVILPLGVTEAAVEACRNKSTNNGDFVDCIVSSTLSPQAARVYSCMERQGSEADITMCILENFVDNEDASKMVGGMRACYRESGTSWNHYGPCLARQHLGKKEQKIAQCIQQGLSNEAGKIDYWQIAICSYGDELLGRLKPNQETMVLIECAKASGGEPEVFVGCAGGRLLADELQKCLDDGFERQGGCFGDSNTITKIYDDMEARVIAAYGANSPQATAWKAARLSTDPRAMIDFVDDARKDPVGTLRKAIPKKLPKFKL
jgi:hypothetical protein